MGYDVIKSQMKAVFSTALLELLGEEEAGRRMAVGKKEGQLDLLLVLADLETTYGRAAGQGLALRQGKICYKVAQRCLPELAKMQAVEFRVLPLSTKLGRGLAALAEIFNQALPLQCVLEEAAHGWRLESNGLPHEAGRAWLSGFVQEALYGFSSGKCYRLETEGKLPQTVFLIDQKPLE